ncbi:MAG: glycosyltransferase family 2 protein [Candidatus Acidiferrales bacterium]
MSQTISIIIPTKERCESLLRAVRSIANQTVVPSELIIVDQTPGSDEAREEVLKICPAEIRLKYIWNPEIASLTIARNIAMEQTSGDIVLFLDDDVSLHPDFIERLLSCWAEHPEATGISGVPDNYSPPGAFYHRWSQIFMRGPFRDDRQPVYWHAAEIQTPIRVTRLSGGMTSFRRRAIVGKQFDANLRGGSDGEDVDFCMHLDPGAMLLIDPRCKLTHHFDPTGRAKDHWVRRHARAYTYLYFRNWRSHRLAYLWLWCGWALATTLGCASRRSVNPLRLLASGYREGRSIPMTQRAVGSHVP